MAPIALCHTDRGEGETLLLVHGWGGHARTWAPIADALQPGHRVITADLRGHGGSPAPMDGYRPIDLAGDLVALLDRLDAGPVVAVGHSMGAQVVTTMAVERPEHVSALVVVDPAYGADAAEERLFGKRLAALRANGAAAAVRQLGTLPAEVRAQLLATPGHVLAACYEGMYLGPDAFGARPATRRYLARRTRPVLCVRSLSEPAAWESSIPAPSGSQMVTWDGTGHFLHLARPQAFAGLLRRWLATLRPHARARA
ncbi:alpha/beta fold hydrolase [Nonomuraea sp. CA-143628]|uniref:alpha/beta fold hydrolase n=1 Tax=Nonomuraea sp. CA-143628 TaxID=3239997 RepID=UPI003D9408EC